MVQTSYPIEQAAAFHGQLYSSFDNDVFSAAAETEVDFGIVVSRGTDPDNQVVPGGALGVGISVRSLEREGVAGSGLISYAATETVGYVRNGYIYITCVDGCVPGDQVVYTAASGVIGTGAIDLVGAFWQSTTPAGEIGLIRIVTAQR